MEHIKAKRIYRSVECFTDSSTKQPNNNNNLLFNQTKLGGFDIGKYNNAAIQNGS